MAHVKTFTSDLQIFKTAKQLEDLDVKVNEFLKTNPAKSVISISDTTVSDEHGATQGIIRVVAYE